LRGKRNGFCSFPVLRGFYCCDFVGAKKRDGEKEEKEEEKEGKRGTTMLLCFSIQFTSMYTWNIYELLSNKP
jgi:hypothetical protein